MGYFKRPVRRSAARRDARRALDASRDVPPSAWTPAPASPVALRERFVRLRMDFGGDAYTGFFIGVGDLLRDPETPDAPRRALRRHLGWFNRVVTAPTDREVEPDAVFWFRTTNAELLRHAWALVRVARACGVEVLVETSDRPGRVVYQDEHQVAAVRFSDAPSVTRSCVPARSEADLAAPLPVK